MRPPQGQYRIGAFKPFMPDWARFLVFLITVCVFQLSGSIYLANVNEMVGATALTAEDVRLLASTANIGMTVIFPALFRIKFRFMSRTILLTCASVVLIGNMLMILTTNMPVLLAVSFTVGMFKMIGTFECFSSMQLAITPKRDMAVFFSFIYLIILGAIPLSGVLGAFFSDMGDWRQMYLAVMAALVIVITFLACTLRPFRFIKKMPLYQIDWLSMGLWSGMLLLLNFVFEYGARLDWFDSKVIRFTLMACMAMGSCLVFRMFTTRRPYISPSIFMLRNFLFALFLFAAMQALLSPAYVVLPSFTSGALRYDVLNSASLDWALLAGIVVGSAGSYIWLCLLKGQYKPIIFSGFLFLVLAHLLLMLVIGPSIPKESLYLPCAMRGVGTAVLFISLMVYMVQGVPFMRLFQTIALLCVVRDTVGATISNALCNEVLEHMYKCRRMLLGQELDRVNIAATGLRQDAILGSEAQGHGVEQAMSEATNTLYGKLNLQAMLASWKQVLGWWALGGALMLVLIIFYHYMKPGTKRLPTMPQMAAYLKPVVYAVRRVRRKRQTVGMG